MKSVIIYISESSRAMAEQLRGELGFELFAKGEGSYSALLKENWPQLDNVVFIGAMGICVRAIAPLLKSKYEDPAVVCIPSGGQFVIPVVSGHIGGANDLARRIAGIIGAQAVVTTQSDGEGLWALDTLSARFGWAVEATPAAMNRAIIRTASRGRG